VDDYTTWEDMLYSCACGSTSNTDFHNCLIENGGWLCTTTLCN